MRFLVLALIVVLGAGPAAAASPAPPPSPAVSAVATPVPGAPPALFPPAPPVLPNVDKLFRDEKSKIGYCIGVQISTSLKNHPFEIDPLALAQGISEGLSPKGPKVSFDDARAIVNAHLRVKMKELSEKNLKAGDAFLEENKKRDGVKVLASGVQYKVVNDGKGVRPKATDTVVAHYRGTLIDGKEFDSSFKRGQPAELRVNQVIPGWTEVLQLMGVGSKWQVWLPSKVAYGERSPGPIPPNSTLCFEIELVKVKPEVAPK